MVAHFILVLEYRVMMTSAQQVEMLKRKVDEFTAQMIEIRHESSSIAMNAELTHGNRGNNGSVCVKTAPRGHESREARVVRTWQRL